MIPWWRYSLKVFEQLIEWNIYLNKFEAIGNIMSSFDFLKKYSGLKIMNWNSYESICFPRFNFFNMKMYIFAFKVGDNLSNLSLI